MPRFVSLQVAQFAAGTDFDLDQVDKTTWSLVGSGLSLSFLYLWFVLWVDASSGRLALVVPVDLTWTELVAAYPLLIAVAVCLGLLVGRALGLVRQVARGTGV